MEGDRILIFLSHLFYFLGTACCSTHRHKEDIALCLTSHGLTNFTTPRSPHYNHFLHASLNNLVFSRPTFLRPNIIILPHNLDQLTAAIRCSTESSLTIRLRSGGHSYEGLSSTATTPFAIIDFMNLDRVTVDLKTNTAWAESGATLGMIYHAVAVAAPNLGFPAGYCATVGSGGHFSGGGYGMLVRMYGLAADNVIDAVLVDARGQVLDRAGMGEDVFWAIRGGGGGSWGAVYSWKIQLHPVPKTVTSFTVVRNGTSTDIAKLLHKWQFVAPKLEDEFYLTASVVPESANQLSAQFQGFYAGPKARTGATLTRVFPELGLEEDQCNESSWIEAVFYFSNGKSLLDRFDDPMRGFFKVKGDIVRELIPLEGLKGAMERLVKMPTGGFGCIPNGGIMHRINTNAIPYPHRANNLFEVDYFVGWSEEEDGESDTYIDWVRGLHGYMTPFVSKDPRASEVNQLDLDYGVMNWENVSVCDAWKVAKSWGERYFMGNYERLVRAKTLIDPNNVFRHPQSIPPLPNSCGVPAFPPIYGSVGLLWSGSWQLCQAAVEAVLKGAPIMQISTEAATGPPLKAYDIRHVSKDESPASQALHKVKTRSRFKRSAKPKSKPNSAAGLVPELPNPIPESAPVCNLRWRRCYPDESARAASHDSSDASHQSEPNADGDSRETESMFSVETAEASIENRAESERVAQPDSRVEDGELGLELTLGFEPVVLHASRVQSARHVLKPDQVGCNADTCKVELGLDLTA